MKIGFIGTGNMGGALLRGILNSGFAAPSDINIYDKDFAKASELQALTGVSLKNGNIDLVKSSDYIIVAVKPVFIGQVLEECSDAMQGKVIVSIAAGVSIRTFKEILGESSKIVRTMPNIPAVVGEGMTLLSYDNNLNADEKNYVKKLFECSGRAEELDERLMSEVIALTGSSPAYVFVFIEAMADAAVYAGIPRTLAYRLAAQTVLGSAKMVLESGHHPAELKDQVCSPAGTTIEAIATLEKNGFRHAVIDAMNECTKKAREIGKAAQGSIK